MYVCVYVCMHDDISIYVFCIMSYIFNHMKFLFFLYGNIYKKKCIMQCNVVGFIFFIKKSSTVFF